MTKIELVPPSPADKDLFFSWRNDRRIWRWCRQSGPISYAQHLNYWAATDMAEDRRMFAIVSGKTVGCAGLTSIDHVNRRAEFSCYIGPEHQRKGFARAALTELFNHGFDDLNLNLIWGETFDGNPALDLFLDLGMEKEGTRHQFYYKEGKYLDAHLISVTGSKWVILQSF